MNVQRLREVKIELDGIGEIFFPKQYRDDSELRDPVSGHDPIDGLEMMNRIAQARARAVQYHDAADRMQLALDKALEKAGL